MTAAPLTLSPSKGLERPTAFEPASGAATGLPLAILEPTLRAVIAGTCTRIRRPAGKLLVRIAPGDRLWVREPFHCAAKFNGMAPLSVAFMRGLPTFAVDVHPRMVEVSGLGPRRNARAMPKAWHRQHLVVTAVRRERLQAIPEADIRAEGFEDGAAYAAAWDRNLAFFARAPGTYANRTTRPGSWADNPTVLVIDFERIGEPLR